jgi:hypothetical protein
VGEADGELPASGRRNDWTSLIISRYSKSSAKIFA